MRKLVGVLLLIVILFGVGAVPGKAQDNASVALYSELAWSPDGAYLAYRKAFSGRTRIPANIWVYDFATATHRNLTANFPGKQETPVWSPDSTRIAFVSQIAVPQPGRPVREDAIWIMNLDGSNAVNLSPTALAVMRTLSFSPDGQWLGAFTIDEFRRASGWMIAVDGSGAILLDPDPDLSVGPPHFSPDGSQAVFYARSFGDFTVHQVWVVPMENGGPGMPTLVFSMPEEFELGDWVPNQRAVMLNVPRAFGRQPEVLDSDTGELTPLPSDFIGGHYPHWSPDGSKVAFSDSGELWVAQADGSNPIHLTMGRVRRFGEVAWSPDSTQLAINIMVDDETAGERDVIWVMNADGSGLTDITPPPE